jgi:integrase
MDILPIPEKQREPSQLGGWQKMARRRYQNGCIRKRGKRNPVWELLWWEDFIKEDGSLGRRLVSKTLGRVRDLTLRQARKLAEERLRPLNLGRIAPLSTITLGDFVEKHFVPNVFPVLKPSTRDRYRRTLNNHIMPTFGSRRLCDLGTLELQRFILQKADTGLSWACVDHYRHLLSKIFSSAKKWAYYSSENPVAGVELPEKKPVREKHVLTPQQISSLLDVLREPVRTMFLVAILTGLRIGEVLGLRWKDLDLTAVQLRVEQAYYRGQFGSPKTQGSKRCLPLPPGLVDVLVQYRSKYLRNGPEDLLFQSSSGKPLNDTNLLHRHLKPAGQQIGAPWLNWHTLRRTHATLFQMVGGSLKDAQAQLGHSKLSTTLEIYTLPIPSQQRLAVEKLFQVLLTNVDENKQLAKEMPAAVQQIQ